VYPLLADMLKNGMLPLTLEVAVAPVFNAIAIVGTNNALHINNIFLFILILLIYMKNASMNAPTMQNPNPRKFNVMVPATPVVASEDTIMLGK
jgi:hypothetical protein